MSAGHKPEARVVDRIAHRVSTAACIWITLVALSILIGWLLHDAWLVEFPTPAAPGTTMATTAIALLAGAGSLWLQRDETRARGARRQCALILAAACAAIGLGTLVQYALDIDSSIDWRLERAGAADLLLRFPGRPSLASSVSFLASGLALIWLDAHRKGLRRAAEALTLTVTYIAAERFISFLFHETGAYLPGWRILGELVLQPMSPKTAACFLALSLGILYARPERGLVALFLSRAPTGSLARWLLSAAIVLPVVFAWLGLVSIRSGLRAQYPLSPVVTTMAVLLIVVVSLNARTIDRVVEARSRALKRVGEKERLLRAVFDNAGAGIALVDVMGRPVATNRTLREMLGFTQAELSNMSFPEFTHRDDAGEDQLLFAELVSGARDSYRIEKRYLRKNGQMFWGQLNVSVARDAQQRPEFIIRMVEDITERKKAEEAKERLTEILEATPDFVGIADAGLRALYVNRGGRELTGVDSVEDVSGLTIPDFHPVAAARAVVHTGIPAAQKDGVWHGETELLDKDGRAIPVSQVLLAHRRAGTVSYYSTIMRDITDRKRLEDTQQFLLEASRAFAGSLDRDAILRSMAEMSVPGRADYCAVELVPPDGHAERVAVSHSEAAAGKQPSRFRLRKGKGIPLIERVLRTGEPVLAPVVTNEWLRANMGDGPQLEHIRKLAPRSLMVVPMRARDRILGTICFCITDSTRRYDAHDLRLAEQLATRASLALENAQLFQQSREATRLRDEVLRVVAHDLRNPLNTISLSVGLLEEQMTAAERDRYGDKLDLIARSVARADHLIQDLLDVARMQAGRLTVELQPVDPRSLVEEAVRMHQPLAGERSITLRAEVAGAPGAVSADRRRLQQVLANLIGNALKFTHQGGHVTVCARVQEDAVQFAVQDDGPGIDAADMPGLFDPFWQARTGAGGAGLGLAICRGIAEAHGGRIWAESEPGQGSTFYFTVPLNRSRADSQSLAAD